MKFSDMKKKNKIKNKKQNNKKFNIRLEIVEILALHQIRDGRNANGPGVTEPYTDQAHSMTA